MLVISQFIIIKLFCRLNLSVLNHIFKFKCNVAKKAKKNSEKMFLETKNLFAMSLLSTHIANIVRLKPLELEEMITTPT